MNKEAIKVLLNEYGRHCRRSENAYPGASSIAYANMQSSVVFGPKIPKIITLPKEMYDLQLMITQIMEASYNHRLGMTAVLLRHVYELKSMESAKLLGRTPGDERRLYTNGLDYLIVAYLVLDQYTKKR